MMRTAKPTLSSEVEEEKSLFVLALVLRADSSAKPPLRRYSSTYLRVVCS